jgi:hypothetical protein
MRRTGRKVAIDLEMPVSGKGVKIPTKSTARLFDGMCSGIRKLEKYFD